MAAARCIRALAAADFDPACGFLHAPKDGRASLVYDTMELLRADLDTRILTWAAGQTWRRADFPVQKDGVVRLQPGLAKIAAVKGLAPAGDIAAAVAWFETLVAASAPQLQAVRDFAGTACAAVARCQSR